MEYLWFMEKHTAGSDKGSMRKGVELCVENETDCGKEEIWEINLVIKR